MDKEIHVLMEIDGEAESVVVASLYDAGVHAAAFIRNLNLEKHLGAEVKIELEIVQAKRPVDHPEF
jgi:hypothetical protein